MILYHCNDTLDIIICFFNAVHSEEEDVTMSMKSVAEQC